VGTASSRSIQDLAALEQKSYKHLMNCSDDYAFIRRERERSRTLQVKAMLKKAREQEVEGERAIEDINMSEQATFLIKKKARQYEHKIKMSSRNVAVAWLETQLIKHLRKKQSLANRRLISE